MMQLLGKFTRYIPEESDIPGATYVRNEEGTDWYSIAWDKERIAGKVYAGTDDDGDIVCVTDDGSALFPVDMTVWEIPASEAPDNILTEGYRAMIIDGVYQVNNVVITQETRAGLLREADDVIRPLERAVKHGMATPEEAERLEAWERYSVLLSRVNPGEEWPEKPE
ncbi:tail fiber assembly protein [Enterobacter sp.]|uniref:tail fiber assembly protein n=1 Tax=Enterobacter sp. TaxID=42895 RepID=UPI003D10C5CD